MGTFSAPGLKVSSEATGASRSVTFSYQTGGDAVTASFTRSARASYDATPSPVPEPQGYALMLAGLVGVAGAVRRRAAG